MDVIRNLENQLSAVLDEVEKVVVPFVQPLLDSNEAIVDGAKSVSVSCI